MTDEEAYHELCGYTLAHRSPAFIHQHVVDAYKAQSATASTKPIGITFSLVGLYLHIEKGFSGRQVQLTHMTMARRKRTWPPFVLPPERGAITARAVLNAPEGLERDRAIHDWCTSVWDAFRGNRQTVVDLLSEYGIA